MSVKIVSNFHGVIEWGIQYKNENSITRSYRKHDMPTRVHLHEKGVYSKKFWAAAHDSTISCPAAIHFRNKNVYFWNDGTFQIKNKSIVRKIVADTM